MTTSSANQTGGSRSSPTRPTVSPKPDEREALLPHTLTQLAALYRVDRRTMRSWLKKIEHIIGPRHGYLYSPEQVRLIRLELGRPPDLKRDGEI